MVRPTQLACLGLAVSAALASASTAGAMPPFVLEVTSTLGQAPAWRSSAHAALNHGIGSYRRSDYEGAATSLAQAQAGVMELTVEEQQELAHWTKLNNKALQAQRNGAAQIRQAERALLEARLQDAEALLKSVNSNQFLTAEDKKKAQELSARLHPSVVMPKSTAAGTGPSPAVVARTKLHQARAMLAQGNFDAAEALAREANQIGVFYQPGEDTPAKVRADIARLRNNARSLLAAARAAYQRGDLDGAEHLARQADRIANPWTFFFRGDSPSKVLKDVYAARATGMAPVIQNPAPLSNHPGQSDYGVRHIRITPYASGQTPSNPGTSGMPMVSPAGFGGSGTAVQVAPSQPGTPAWPASAKPAEASSDGEDARQLVDHARQVLQQSQMLTQAQPMKSTMPPADAAGLGHVSGPGVPATGGAEPDPHLMVKLGRALYNANKLDEAEKMAKAAQGHACTHWGFFEDSPSKLLRDIHNTRVRREQKDSAQVLSQARQLFEQGQYEEAKQKAQLAAQLHGPYFIWDFGDQPQKLIVEIDAAEARMAKAGRPKAGASDLASQHAERTEPAPADAGSVARVTPYSQRPQEVSVPAGPIVDQAPAPVLASMPPAEGTATATVASSGLPAAPVAAKVVSPKQHVQQLLAEAHTLQQQGRFLAAREKIMEVQKAGVEFTTDEDSPARALAQLSALACKRIDALLEEATDQAAAGSIDPVHYRKADECLLEARQLATAFALDCQPIEAKMAWIQQTRGKSRPGQLPDSLPSESAGSLANMAARPGHESQPGTGDIQQHGRQLLDSARAAIRRGDNDQARRLVEQAYNGPYGVQAEAEALLRTICAEEYNQRAKVASLSFDTGLDLYRCHKYAQAYTVFKTVDASLLRPDKRAKLRELMQTPEMQASNLVQASAAMPTPAMRELTGKATASDIPGQTHIVTPEQNYAQQVEAMHQIQFQKLRYDGLKAQRDATERFRNGDSEQALDILQEYLAVLQDSTLEPEKIALLRQPIDSRLQQFKMLKAQEEFEQQKDASRHNWQDKHNKKLQAEEHKQQEVAELMQQYDTLYNEGKYAEAEVAAMKASDLDPDNSAAAAAIQVAHMHANLQKYEKNKANKEDVFNQAMEDTDELGPFADTEHPIRVNESRSTLARKRQPLPAGIDLIRAKGERELEIERQLTSPTSMDFKDVPLGQVISDLSASKGINIVPDKSALEDAGVSLDRPMTMKLENVDLKSALDLLLKQAHLIYVIQDQVLLITTEANAQGKMVRRIYPVGDIVIPVEDHSLSPALDFTKIMENQIRSPFSAANGTAPPGMEQNPLSNGTTVSSSGSMADAGSGQWAIQKSNPLASSRTPGQTIQDLLMELITNTIKPESWSKLGGQATIDYYPLGMALIVTQTQDIQEQIQDLLTQLRRLQDLEVAVEVRFITLNESFYERIGVNFSLNIVNRQTKFEPQLISGNFAPSDQFNVFQPSHFLSGITEIPSGGVIPGTGGAFTSDLGIPIHPGSFAPAIPPFGGFANAPPDGGINFGLAFLSDIQVFMLLEAAQGDSRSNIMQAPKLTMFNGQTATVTIAEDQFFLTNVGVVRENSQFVFVPLNAPIPVLTSVTINTVVSADRRFVRMNIAPILTNMSSPVVPLFPVTTFLTPVFEGGATGQPIPFTQYLQQPSFTIVTITSTVSVPDGGTVLLGGLKTLREGRTEFGPPILSKLPYINRLFKNVGYGREAESLLLMVTPRIIINEEEETLALEGRPSLIGGTGGPGGLGAGQQR